MENSLSGMEDNLNATPPKSAPSCPQQTQPTTKILERQLFTIKCDAANTNPQLKSIIDQVEPHNLVRNKDVNEDQIIQNNAQKNLQLPLNPQPLSDQLPGCLLKPLKALDDIEFMMYHQLGSKWTLWYLAPDRPFEYTEWTTRLMSLIDFQFVEEFWSIQTHMKPPSELPEGSDFSVFKRGIQPMWEDPQNENGGRWLILIPKNTNYPRFIDQCWQELLLCLISGGTFGEYEDEVVGGVVCIRAKTYKMSVWTRTSDDDAVAKIGLILKEQLMGVGMRWMGFKVHNLM